MLNNWEEKPLILNEKHKIIIDEWFSMLQKNEYNFNGFTYNGLKLRAELRRQSLPYGVMLQEGYWILADRLFNENKFLIENKNHHQALALFVAVAVFAKNNNDNASFAFQLSEKNPVGERSIMSPLRFNQLIACDNDEVFCRRLIRAVKLRNDNGVNIFSLADGIFLWIQERHDCQLGLPSSDLDPFKRNSIRWAMNYYSNKKNFKEQ